MFMRPDLSSITDYRARCQDLHSSPNVGLFKGLFHLPEIVEEEEHQAQG